MKSTSSIVRVGRDHLYLQVAAGDYLIVGADAMPRGLIRKIEGETAAACLERFGQEAVLLNLHAVSGPAEPSAIDLLRGDR